jgi:hypothetical protein
MSETYSVFVHNQKLHTYTIYYSDGRFIKDSNQPPDETLDKFEHSKLTNKKIYEQIKNGLTMKDILKNYSEDIQLWRDEILNCNSLLKKFDFFKIFIKTDGTRFQNTNESNILIFFTTYSSKIQKSKFWDPLSWNEYLWYEKPYNGGLMKCKPGEYDCIGYDFKMSYPAILASQVKIFDSVRDFYFPIKEGTEAYLFDIPKKSELVLGLYRVKIECDNDDFLFIFNLKYDTNVYTNLDIAFCLKHKKQFKIRMTIIIDDEPNALIYKKGCDSQINGKHVFKPWYDRLVSLKKELPNNGLIKMLSSSIWGYLSKINKRFYNDEELDEKNIEFDYEDNKALEYLCLKEKDNNHTGTTDYMLINKTKPYCKNYRLKPFITSFQRLLIAEISLEIGISKIVRINTDNITFNKQLLTRKDLLVLANISPTFIPEDKTTGKFFIENINKFTPI